MGGNGTKMMSACNDGRTSARRTMREESRRDGSLHNSQIRRWLPILTLLFGTSCASDGEVFDQEDETSQLSDAAYRDGHATAKMQPLAIAPADVYGAIGDRYRQIGGASSWLGLPTTDEIVIPENGRVRRFQHGDIYWWPDVGARDVGSIVIDYTGFHCFGETDWDPSDDDEVYATVGVSAPGRAATTFQSAIQHAVNAGDARTQFSRIYQGPPNGVTLNVLLTEWSNGDPAKSREVMGQAVTQVGAAVAGALLAVPTFGWVLGPAAGLAVGALKDTAANALQDLVAAFGLVDRPLGSDVIALSQKQMVLLATRPEGHVMFGPIPWRFETALLSRYGASYKVYFNIYPG